MRGRKTPHRGRSAKHVERKIPQDAGEQSQDKSQPQHAQIKLAPLNAVKSATHSTKTSLYV